MTKNTTILFLLFVGGFNQLFAVDSGPKIKRVCLDVSDSMAYVYWEPVTDPCASFTKYEVYGREDKFSLFQLLKTELALTTNNSSIKLANLKRWQFFILVSNSCSGMNTFSSDTIFLDNEEPTQWQFDSISVDCKTQKITAGWRKHDTTDVEGYYVYNVNGGSNSLIGTELDYTFNGLNEDPTMGPITHLISAFDSCKNASPLSLPSTTIFLSQSIDTCLNTLYFNWSHYVGWSTIGEYRLFVSINSGSFIPVKTIPGNTNTTNFKYTPGDTICTFIRATNGEKKSITSSSNKLCQNTNALKKPSYLYINKVTIENHDTLKVYSVQDETNIDSMVLLRRIPGGVWSVIDNIKPVSATYSYTDLNADVNELEYEYHLIAFNSCRQRIDSSNTSKNILLRLTNSDNLEWSEYYSFDAGVDKYDLYNSANSSTWNMESSTSDNGSSTYTYTPFALTTIDGAALCFCVQGVEQGPNQFTRQDTSFSNAVCTKGKFTFFVPNAFKPSGVNKVFLPFTQNLQEVGYKMTITNRWGEVYFETTNPLMGWDGNYQGGPVQMGAYVYIIAAQGKDGTKINKSGTIMLIR